MAWGLKGVVWNVGLHDTRFPLDFGDGLQKSLTDRFRQMLNLLDGTKADFVFFQEPSLSPLAVSILVVPGTIGMIVNSILLLLSFTTSSLLITPY